ncbi:putative DNA primase, eukaryotic-type, small subunit [Puccinia sorghi]|uniref:DNA primase n=1 Tax=Puccinia sorghi TaxID=27349 RepID=A0A0L6V4M9_9BASI|nr:putative DNA primase, eukaryotic-type, small subunit [Puccinia sorghi]
MQRSSSEETGEMEMEAGRAKDALRSGEKKEGPSMPPLAQEAEALGETLKDVPLDQLFDDEMDLDHHDHLATANDDAPLGPKEYRHLAQFDDPWADLKDPHVMMTYYRRIFPWKQLYLWLNQDHVPSYLFTQREFAITLQNEAYLRYNSYSSHTELQKDMIRLNPTRFEIGAIYSGAPKDRKTIPKAGFKPVERELVLDIDLTDYDDCWKLVAVAVELLDETLRKDFGYKHLLWVYSGRRGAHCWVSDPDAMRLSDDQRKALVNYINLFKSGGGGSNKYGLKIDLKSPLHPMVQRSLETISTKFDEVVLQGQEVFLPEENWRFLLRIWADPSSARVSPSRPPIPRKPSTGGVKRRVPAVETKQNVMLHYSYARIDMEVTKHQNHLLKSPFCVHPATGKVCIPLNPAEIFKFVPDSVPDVRDLLRQLDHLSHSSSSNPNHNPSDWASTALKPHIEFFQKHIDAILHDRLLAKQQMCVYCIVLLLHQQHPCKHHNSEEKGCLSAKASSWYGLSIGQ